MSLDDVLNEDDAPTPFDTSAKRRVRTGSEVSTSGTQNGFVRPFDVDQDSSRSFTTSERPGRIRPLALPSRVHPNRSTEATMQHSGSPTGPPGLQEPESGHYAAPPSYRSESHRAEEGRRGGGERPIGLAEDRHSSGGPTGPPSTLTSYHPGYSFSEAQAEAAEQSQREATSTYPAGPRGGGEWGSHRPYESYPSQGYHYDSPPYYSTYTPPSAAAVASAPFPSRALPPSRSPNQPSYVYEAQRYPTHLSRYSHPSLGGMEASGPTQQHPRSTFALAAESTSLTTVESRRASFHRHSHSLPTPSYDHHSQVHHDTPYAAAPAWPGSPESLELAPLASPPLAGARSPSDSDGDGDGDGEYKPDYSEERSFARTSVVLRMAPSRRKGPAPAFDERRISPITGLPTKILSKRSYPPKDAARRRFFCTSPGCTKSFGRPSARETHLRTHNGVKPFTCPVPDCARTFSVFSNLKRHMIVHPGIDFRGMKVHDLPHLVWDPTHNPPLYFGEGNVRLANPHKSGGRKYAPDEEDEDEDADADAESEVPEST